MREQSFAMRALVESVVGMSEVTRQLAVAGPGAEPVLDELRRKLAAVTAAVGALGASSGEDFEFEDSSSEAPSVSPTTSESIVDSLDDVFGATGLY